METNREYRMANGFFSLMCARSVNSDISEEFTLPDYCPEIRRVLYVKEELPLPARFMGGGKIDVNGALEYTLVYVNGEGEVCSAPLNTEYSFTLPIENANEFELGEGITVMAHTVAESSSVRVSSPRRLQIRSHLCTNVCAYGKMLCPDNCEGLEDEESVERLEGESECAQIFCESSDVITLNDEYTLSREGERIALADSSVCVESSRISGESVLVSGEACVRMLLLCEGESETVTRRLPFEAEIDLGGIELSGEASARINAFVTDTSIDIEDGRVGIELCLVLEACICQTSSLVYTRDVYSTKQECQTHTKAYGIPTVLANKGFNLTQSERLTAAELNFPEGAQIVHVVGSGAVGGIAPEGDKTVIRGTCKYDLICLVGGEYTHVEARVPFSYEADIDTDVQVFDSALTLKNCRALSEGEHLSFNAELYISCTAMGSKSIDMPVQICFGELRDEQSGRWSACYVGKDEDLWSIAKRYGVSPKCIKGDVNTDRFVLIER